MLLVTPETEASFTTIVDSILAASDLNTVSEKRIRKGLQATVSYDITPLKVFIAGVARIFNMLTMSQEPIKALIMTRFDKFIAEKNPIPESNGHTTNANGQSSEVTPEATVESIEPKQEPSLSPSPPKNGRKRESAEEEMSDVSVSPSKKKKRKAAPVDADAAFAARLQAEENGRARATRGGVNKKSTSAKKRTDRKALKKKTSHKVKAEDDSDLEGSGSEVTEKKVNRSGGFHVSLIFFHV